MPWFKSSYILKMSDNKQTEFPEVAYCFYCVASPNSPMPGDQPGKAFNPERTRSNFTGNATYQALAFWRASRVSAVVESGLSNS